MMILKVNGITSEINVPPSMPLLWVLREKQKLTGTKFGCGIGACGACTVHVDGVPTRSCVTPVSAAQNHDITTIEGLNDDLANQLRQAWAIQFAAQCGYCQPAQIMTAHHLLKSTRSPSPTQMNDAMNGVLCRCGTYRRIRLAIEHVSNVLVDQP